jgi:RimJ/RimL family protein N-acetyltransferase
MIVQGSTFTLRPFREDDADAVTDGLGNRAVWRNLCDVVPHPFEPTHFTAWLGRIAEDKRQTNWAVACDGRVVGNINLANRGDVFHRSRTIGYWLAEPYWGRGIASEAVRLVSSYAFTEMDVVRLEAIVFGWNPASCRVLEKNGYTLEGRQPNAVCKDGDFTDLLHYGRVRADAP